MHFEGTTAGSLTRVWYVTYLVNFEGLRDCTFYVITIVVLIVSIRVPI